MLCLSCSSIPFEVFLKFIPYFKHITNEVKIVVEKSPKENTHHINYLGVHAASSIVDQAS